LECLGCILNGLPGRDTNYARVVRIVHGEGDVQPYRLHIGWRVVGGTMRGDYRTGDHDGFEGLSGSSRPSVMSRALCVCESRFVFVLLYCVCIVFE